MKKSLVLLLWAILSHILNHSKKEHGGEVVLSIFITVFDVDAMLIVYKNLL